MILINIIISKINFFIFEANSISFAGFDFCQKMTVNIDNYEKSTNFLHLKTLRIKEEHN